jgi:hypothetical protein
MLTNATLSMPGLTPIDILRALANLWNLALLVAVAVSLLCFLYWVFLKKLLRARRIANIRLNRLMHERGAGPTEHR